ncbi:MAG: 3-oxoacyl-[acyl-carrier-protein] synthase [Chloroflexota bacterium]|jgi:3-oxoacyl-[acyl-carrier-protein] synthase-3|nr:3-oxoacyl-[acyl-carrier-protein] synthase [Chloroflexota bacterium]
MPSLAKAGRGLALAGIAGLGIYRPAADAPSARRVTGSDLTGVSYRVQADQGVNTASLAAGAARAALQAGGVNPADIEMIIVGTTTPDVLWPTTACLVQNELKLPMVASFDLYAAETSLLAALNVGIRYIASGARSVLLIGADSDNQLVDLPGQSGSVHSRAAAAAVLTRATGDGGVLSTMAGGAARPEGNGDASDRTMLQGLTDGATECLQKASLSPSDIDLVIGEQSAPEIMQAWGKVAGIAPSRLLLDPARYGSLLAAAPLTVLHDAIKEGRLQNGMTALVLACGSGPTWAAACLRWGGGGLAEC